MRSEIKAHDAGKPWTGVSGTQTCNQMLFHGILVFAGSTRRRPLVACWARSCHLWLRRCERVGLWRAEGGGRRVESGCFTTTFATAGAVCTQDRLDGSHASSLSQRRLRRVHPHNWTVAIVRRPPQLDIRKSTPSPSLLGALASDKEVSLNRHQGKACCAVHRPILDKPSVQARMHKQCSLQCSGPVAHLSASSKTACRKVQKLDSILADVATIIASPA